METALATACTAAWLIQEVSVIPAVSRACKKGSVSEHANIWPWLQGLIGGFARAYYFNHEATTTVPFVLRISSLICLIPGAFAALSGVRYGAVRELRMENKPTTSTKNEARGPDEIDRMIFCLVAGIFLPAAISFSQSHSASGWYFVAAIMASRVTYLMGLRQACGALLSADAAVVKASETSIDALLCSLSLLSFVAWAAWAILYLNDVFVFLLNAASALCALPPLLLKISLRLRLRLEANRQAKELQMLDLSKVKTTQIESMEAWDGTRMEDSEVTIAVHDDDDGDDDDDVNNNDAKEEAAIDASASLKKLIVESVGVDVLRLLQGENTTIDGNSLQDASAAESLERSQLAKRTQPLPSNFFDEAPNDKRQDSNNDDNDSAV